MQLESLRGLFPAARGKDPWAHFFRASASLSNGKTKEARAECSRFMRSGPRAAALALRGLIAAGERRWDRAGADLSRAAALSPGQAWPWTLKAAVLQAAGDFPGARQALEKAVRKSPSAELYALLGEADEKLGMMVQAIESAQRAVELEPSLENHRRKAAFLLRWREYDRVIEEYSRALSRYPGEAALFFDRSKAYAAAGRLREALKDAEAAVMAGLKSEHALVWRFQMRILNRRPSGRAETPFCRAYAEIFSGRFHRASATLTKSLALSGHESQRLKATFYRAVADSLLSPEPKFPPARLYLVGLGVNPPYSATAESLRVLRRCDVVFNNVPGDEVSELLFLFSRDYRPVAYHQDYDEAEIAAQIMAEVRAGRSAAFVTRGSAIVYGLLGAELLRLCREAGIACVCLPAVSSAELLDAKFGGKPPRARGALLLDDQALGAASALDCSIPLTLYLNLHWSAPKYRKMCRRLLKDYGGSRPCLVLDHQIGQEPLRKKISDLPRLREALSPSAIIYSPPGEIRPTPTPPRLFFLGLGLEPARHATLETLQAARRCDRVYRDGDADVNGILADLKSGKTVGYESLAHPFYWTAAAGLLVRECKKRGIGWQSFGSVSPAAVAVAAVGLALGGNDVKALQSYDCGAPPSISTAWPLVLYFPGGGLSETRFKTAMSRLAEAFGADHPVFWCRSSETPEIISLLDSAGRFESVTEATVLYLPPL